MGSEERVEPRPSTGGRSKGGFVSLARDLVRERTVLVLAILFALGGGFLLWHQARVHTSIVEGSAVDHAKAYSEALATFRTLYTRDVVEVVRKLDEPVLVTHDFEHRPGSIPLPATFSIRLGKTIH